MRTLTALVALILIISSCRMQREPASEIRSLNSTIEDGEEGVFKLKIKYPLLDADGQALLTEKGMPRFFQGGCSATAYSPSHAITAAHCVINPKTGQKAKPEDIHVIFPDNTFLSATKVEANSEWITEWKDASGNVTTAGSGKPTEFDSTKDLAVLTFLNPFTTYKKISAKSPEPAKSEVKIVGFGLRGFYGTDPISYITGKDLTDEQKKYREQVGLAKAESGEYLDNFRTAFQRLTGGESKEDDPFAERAQRLKDHLDKIDGSLKTEDGRFIKRSGSTTLGGIDRGITEYIEANGQSSSADDMLIFEGKFLESELKDDIDRELFNRLGVYAPDENTDPSRSASGLAASFGDSGGPMLDSDGNLIGVASHVRGEISKRRVLSAYVNLHSRVSQAFFADLKAAGWQLPEVAEETSAGADAEPQPEAGEEGESNPPSPPEDDEDPFNDQPAAPGSPATQANAPVVNNNMAAALASQPNAEGRYHLLISVGLNTNGVWICEGVSKLEDCDTYAKATQSAGRSGFGPVTRFNFQTDNPISVLEPFAIMTETPAGFVSGVIVTGARK